MGDHMSKILSSLRKEDSGAEKDPLEEPPEPPPMDPRLPLTARQLFNITKSWKGISRAMEPTGITMFIKLFEDNEDILHLFQKIQYKRLHELHLDSMELAQHASIVMSTLDQGIKTLNDVDRFTDHLYAIGKLHRRIPGFQRDYFWRIEAPFLAAVQETLGERYTENMENIYKITISFVLNTVIHGFDLAERTSDDQNQDQNPSDQSEQTQLSIQQPPSPVPESSSKQNNDVFETTADCSPQTKESSSSPPIFPT